MTVNFWLAPLEALNHLSQPAAGFHSKVTNVFPPSQLRDNPHSNSTFAGGLL